MQSESLVQLVGRGNTSTEEEWLRLIESPTVAPSVLCGYDVVLAEGGEPTNHHAERTLRRAVI